MVATAERPVTHRAETVREQNLRLELATLRRDVAQDCDVILDRLDRLIPAVVEIGPPALQLLVGATRKAESLRSKVTA